MLILPKLVRHLARSRSISAALREGFMRCPYLASLAVVNAGLRLILTLSFDDGLRNLWLPLTAAPYYALYAWDLRRCGYRLTDVFRVFALNLMLIPVHLSGVFVSLRQAWTGAKSPFGRTPKVQGRPAAPPLYLIVEYAILANWGAGAVFEFLHGRPMHAWFALGNAAFLAYAILCFIGLRESWADFATVTGIGAVGVAPSGARSSSFKSSTAVTTDT